MATIWTGSLVATTSQGALKATKTVYLNAKFVNAVASTSYENLSGVQTPARLVQYKRGPGPDIEGLIFSDVLATLVGSMNTQPTTGRDTFNAVSLTIIPPTGANYTMAVSTDNIWWFEDTGTSNQSFVTVMDATMTTMTTYRVSIVGSSAALRTLINN